MAEMMLSDKFDETSELLGPMGICASGKPSATQATRRQFLSSAALTILSGACHQTVASDKKHAAGPNHTVHEAAFYKRMAGNSVQCELCPRRCDVPDGERGYCRVRENLGGRYYTLVQDHPCVIHLDPIEKKPFFHVYPGCKAYSMATAGCNLHCKFCQNWDISQAAPEEVQLLTATPDRIVEAAARAGARTLAFTYNEPTVFFEYMLACAKAAKQRGMSSVVVSNGFINEEPLRTLLPHINAYKIDLKSFSESFYTRICGARLSPVLETLKRIRSAGTWLEIVCLLIPTLNDSEAEIRSLSAWIVKELGTNVPLHFTRFHPLYQLRNLPATPPETLLRARSLAIQEGCRFVYTGNVPGLDGQDTLCHSCGRTLIRRYGHLVQENRLQGGRCPHCKTVLPGLW